eukprot:4987739-Prymnesium_polylepis.1
MHDHETCTVTFPSHTRHTARAPRRTARAGVCGVRTRTRAPAQRENARARAGGPDPLAPKRSS